LLSEYANASGTTKMNVTELNQHLFKCFVSVVRQTSTELLTKKRLQILLNYVETDVIDPHRQATAFNLAKAIIGKQVRDDKIDELIKYLAELSVTSQVEQIRAQSRSTLNAYFKSHPDGPDNAERWLKFFLEQLDYEFVHGRLSALESIHSILSSFKEVSYNLFNSLISSYFRKSTTSMDSQHLFAWHHDLLKMIMRNVIASWR
jgi:hypothetical protein